MREASEARTERGDWSPAGEKSYLSGGARRGKTIRAWTEMEVGRRRATCLRTSADPTLPSFFGGPMVDIKGGSSIACETHGRVCSALAPVFFSLQRREDIMMPAIRQAP